GAPNGTQTLAHAERPGDKGLHGDIHIDSGESWTLNKLLQVATHEFGHALGLDHANGDVVDGNCPASFFAIMHACVGGGGTWQFNGSETAYLAPDDINGIQSLYGAGLGYVLNLGGIMNVYGTNQNDTLTVNIENGNVTVSTADGRSFTRTVAGITAINLHGMDGYDTLRVEKNSGIPIYMFGGGFDDRCEIQANGRDWSQSAGKVTCWSGNGYDKAYIYDSGSNNVHTYQVNGAAGLGIEIGPGTRMEYDGSVEEVHLITGTQADTVNVWNTSSTANVFLNNANGHDTINVGSGFRLQPIQGRITVAFPEPGIPTPGTYSLNLNDAANPSSPNSIIETGQWSDSTGIRNAAPATVSWFDRPGSIVTYTTGANRSVVDVRRNFTGLNLTSSGGDDVIYIGENGFGMDVIKANISVSAKNGAPEITLADTGQQGRDRSIRVYDHLNGLFQAIGGMGPATIYYQTPKSILLQLGIGNDTLAIDDDLDCDFIAYDTGGNDTFQLNGIDSAYLVFSNDPFQPNRTQTRHYSLSLAGDVGGFDTLRINDRGMVDRQDYELTADRLERKDVDFPLGEGLILQYAKMKSVELLTNDLDNVVRIYGTSPDVPNNSQTTVRMGGGNDYLQVYPRDETGVPTILSKIGVFGESGTDSFYVEDYFNTLGSEWNFSNPFGASTQNISVAGGELMGVYQDIEYIFARGSQGNDVFNVHSYQTPNNLLILGQEGNDRVHITQESMNVVPNINSIYFGFDGGAGIDGVWLHNESAPGDWTYTGDVDRLLAERLEPTHSLLLEFGENEYLQVNGHNGDLVEYGEAPPYIPAIDEVFAAVRNGVANPEFDLNADGFVNQADANFLIHDILMTNFGDANLDRVFDSSDLVRIFQAGEYDDGIGGNSTWIEGDWNGDGEFDSSDLILAFQAGWYER
ncbi:MAG: matrixin family metalloprotease, partial [Planctomycetales bacterium]|nr:matrixin family metalloprotease [Planctomycetales bacterium]